MEGGYSAVDDAALRVKKEQKLFLFRLPKDFNIEDLDGITMNLSEKNQSPLAVGSGSRKKYALKRDTTSALSNLRPVVVNELDGSSTVGKAFEGTYSISEVVDLKMVAASTPLPIRPAYVPVQQANFLRVHTVPLGSTSMVDRVSGTIIPGKVVDGAVRTASKRKETPLVNVKVEPTYDAVEDEEVGHGSEKKHKKHHKEHKESKEHKEKKEKKHKHDKA